MKKTLRLTLGSAVAMMSLVTAARSATDYYQDFAAWTNYQTGSPLTITNEGWYVENCEIKYQKAYMPTNASLVRSPVLANGLGRVKVAACNYAAGSVVFYVEAWSNGTWVTAATYTNTTASTTGANPTWYTNYVNAYDSNVVVRFRKGDSPQRLFLDNLEMTYAPAYVSTANVVTVPSQPLINAPVEVRADVMRWFGASNIAAEVWYHSRSGQPFTNLAMSALSGDTFETTGSGLPALADPGSAVEYYLRVAFQGNDGTVTTNTYPSGAPAGGVLRYTVRANSPFAAMQVAGSQTTNLILAADYQWQGALFPTGALVNPVFYFGSGATTWGDADQAVSNLPVYGEAETGAVVRLQATVTNPLAFLFRDTGTNGLDYSIQNCAYVNFDAWTNAALLTNESGWVIAGAQLSTTNKTDTDRAFLGRFCMLKSGLASTQYLRSPFMPEGLGTVSFWYRHREDPTNSAVGGLLVQKSTNGVDGWVTVSAVTNIQTLGYNRFNLSIADRNYNYARILNFGTSSWVCLDEAIVTAPGATVELTAPRRSITNMVPLGESVQVWVDIKAATGGATNLACSAYFRHTNDATFTEMPLARQTNTFTGSLPPTPPGVVYYYFACTYDGFGAAPAYYPLGGAGDANLLAYTNASTLGNLRFESFAWWYTNNVTPTNITINGWTVYNAYVNNQRARLAAAGSYVQSSLLTNGVGTIYFDACNYAVGTTEIRVMTSYNGADWTTRATYSCITNNASGSNPTTCVTRVQDYQDLYVRILYSDDSQAKPSQPYLYIDNIYAPYPPADVAVTGVSYAPGYPSTNDAVTVACTVASVSSVFPAYNLRPTLKHRMGSGGWSSLDLVAKGSNRYEAVIPAQTYPVGDVSYFTRCDFGGYYFARSPNTDNQSPAFSPDAPPSAAEPSPPYTYSVRPYASDYAYLSVTGNLPDVQMELIGDDLWQGIIDPAGTNWLALGLAGFLRYTGTGYAPGVDTWGDSAPVRSFLPLTGSATLSGSNITFSGTFPGQIIIRFDRRTGTYLIMLGAYQNFNRWYANPDYFDESLGQGNATVLTQNFDAWQTDAPYVTPWGVFAEDFQSIGWITNYYPSMTAGGLGTWYIDDAGILREQDFSLPSDTTNVNKACYFSDASTDGELWTRRDWLFNVAGLNAVNLRFRAGGTNILPTIYNSAPLAWNNYRVEATLQAENYSPMWPSLSLFAKYQDADNYYEYRLERTNRVQLALSIWKRQGGLLSRLGGVSPYNGNLLSAATCQFIAVTNNNGSYYLEAWHNGKLQVSASDTSALSGPGTVGVLTMDADISVDEVRATHMDVQAFANWPNNPATGNYWTAGWSITNGRPTGGACSLATNGTLSSAYVPYSVGSVSFQYQRVGPVTNSQLKFFYSTDGASWVLQDTMSFIVSGNMVTWSNAPATTNCHYFRWQNTSTRDPAVTSGVTAALFTLDSIYITAATNLYTQDFDTAAATNGWSNGGKWHYEDNAFKRAGYIGPSIGFDVDYATTNNSTPSYPDLTNWVNAAHLTASNLVYLQTSIVVRTWDTSFVRLRHTIGTANVVVDNMSLSSWRATNNTERDGWAVRGAWVAPEPGAYTNRVELWRAKVNPAAAQSVRTPYMSNSVGSLSFSYKSAGTPTTFQVQAGLVEIDPETYPVLLDTITTASTNWQPYSLVLNTNAPMYLRVQHTSTNRDAILYLDNMRVTDYLPRDESMWSVWNGRITYNLDPIEFEPLKSPSTDFRSCFLNNHPTNGVKPGVNLGTSLPYLQSAKMPYGIGEISFWYRSWESNATPAGRLYLYSTDSTQPELTPFTNWHFVGSIPTVNNNLYRYFTTNVYEEQEIYLRIYSETSSVRARVCLDNALVTQPIGATFDVDYLKTVPEIPLTNDKVRFETRLSNFFYDPSNIEPRVYYKVGSNSWGTWAEVDWAPLALVSNGALAKIYRTPAGFEVPKQPVDTVVQYYLSCTYQGRFADKASPKTHKRFDNLAWYEPVDLNADQSATNPYYFVFSSYPGDVWINEVNPAYSFWDFTNEFVELCGRAGVDLGNWRIELVDPYLTVYDQAAIAAGTRIPSDTNGFGFFVYGDTNVANVDIRFGTPSDSNISLEGGVRLVRSMGAYEHQVCFGETGQAADMVQYGFEYIGMKDLDRRRSPFYLTGTGRDYTNFTWECRPFSPGPGYTPGRANTDQYLQGNNVAPYVEILITGLRLDTTNVWLVFSGTNTLSPPVPWYSTNLVQSNGWTRVASSTYTYADGVYTQWFPRLTNSRAYFYKVVATNLP